MPFTIIYVILFVLIDMECTTEMLTCVVHSTSFVINIFIQVYFSHMLIHSNQGCQRVGVGYAHGV